MLTLMACQGKPLKFPEVLNAISASVIASSQNVSYVQSLVITSLPDISVQQDVP